MNSQHSALDDGYVRQLKFTRYPLGESEKGDKRRLVWFNELPFQLRNEAQQVTRNELTVREHLAFELENLLFPDECVSLITLAEQLGLHRSTKGYGNSLRNNSVLEWVADDVFLNTLWQRMSPLVTDVLNGQQPIGLNNLVRLYRYDPGDSFNFHSDLGTPRVARLDDRIEFLPRENGFSRLSVLIYLNEGFKGGETQLYFGEGRIMKAHKAGEELKQSVKPKAGNALCFRHGRGNKPLVHKGCVVYAGRKYIMKTDVSYLPLSET